ncbi:MAG TPA: tRNA dihydrouridine synthase DusB [Bacilli bacterium]|nr:MAG: tRNA-dihydrouridine synthase C [Tenericutes bacterium ADurb.BinA124]HNZ49923.1 tRNA dihydrouridine synthase DusB [Bacilli bacterium]HOH18200.1 tRNA dihydrouridine synthase DusB [Bacilli bacterium]HPX84199.1 tRNA dihydrouridine synthase DusB [Bacilli bacterium]HQC74158.1 tRNA dihydrouridine synthase DusB [Bacilli bacterium]
MENLAIKGKLALAPLAGYTNLAYRSIMKEWGADLVFSEMVSAKGLVYESAKTWELTAIDEAEHPLAIQIFGGDLEAMVKAAMMIDQQTTADIIDINMGCPVRKVLKAEGGCFLLSDPKRIETLVREIVKHVQKPVSVKMRAGISHQTINAVANAQAIERAGASFITIHGRTQSDMYAGKVRLDYIKAVKEAVTIPVIGNGDIKSVEDAHTMLEETKVDMIMVGRGSLGNPWLIRDLAHYLKGLPIPPPPTPFEKVKMCKHHFDRLLSIKPLHQALLEMRSLAAWYVKGINHSKDFRKQLHEITGKEQLFNLLDNLLAQQ